MTPWPVKPLSEVAETALGKMLDKGKPEGHPHVFYLRNVNVQWGRIDTDDLLTMELAEDDRDRFGVRDGDLLVCEGGEIGRCAIWRGGGDAYVAYQKALHRIRPGDLLDAKFLRYLLEHYAKTGTLAALATGSTIAHLPQQQLRKVPVPLPRLDEQRRIVAILEDHLSHLDAADAYIGAALSRLDRLREQTVTDAITGAGFPDRVAADLPRVGTADGALPSLPRGWQWRRLGDVADVVGGVTKDTKKQSDPTYAEVPYLRVANVQRGHLKLDDVATIRVPLEKATTLTLVPGDVLLNEGGDRDKLARGWVWEGQIDGCIHQNHVFRARVRDPRLTPEFLSWTANTIGGRWAERNGKQSVNLASISLKLIRLMPVIVPLEGAAEVASDRLKDQLSMYERLKRSLEAAQRHSLSLRRSLLVAAFSGHLSDPGHGVEALTEAAV